jgi:hypothetical protein
MAIFATWAFVAFIYFKVAFDAVFEYIGISIVASLLMGAIFGGVVFFFSGQYFLKLNKYNAKPKQFQATFWDLISITIWQFLGSVIVYAVISRLVIFGFSKELNRQIDIFRRNKLDDDFILFLCLIALPLLVHYIMTLWPTYLNCNSSPSKNSSQNNHQGDNIPPQIHSLTYDDVESFLEDAQSHLTKEHMPMFTQGIMAAYYPIKQAVNNDAGFGDTIHQYVQLTKQNPDSRLKALLPLRFKEAAVEAGFFYVVALLALDYGSVGIFPAVQDNKTIMRMIELNSLAVTLLEKWNQFNAETLNKEFEATNPK